MYLGQPRRDVTSGEAVFAPPYLAVGGIGFVLLWWFGVRQERENAYKWIAALVACFLVSATILTVYVLTLGYGAS